MTLARWARRTDANQAEIIAAMEQVGALVWRISVPFDLLVRYKRHWHVLEVKTADGIKTRGQKSDLARLSWQEQKEDAVSIVRTPEEALCAIGALANP